MRQVNRSVARKCSCLGPGPQWLNRIDLYGKNLIPNGDVTKSEGAWPLVPLIPMLMVTYILPAVEQPQTL